MKKRIVLMICCALIMANINVSLAKNDEEKISKSDIVKVEEKMNKKLLAEKKILLSEIDMSKELDAKDKEVYKSSVSKVMTINDLEDDDMSFDSYIEELNISESSYELKSMIDICKSISEYKSNNINATNVDVVLYMNDLHDSSDSEVGFEINFGVKSFASLYDTWTALTTAEQLLIASSPINALKTADCKDFAWTWTEDEYGYNGLGDESDGYRHAVWNALMSKNISKLWAGMYATAHEDVSQEQLNAIQNDGYYGYQHKEMDLHNNEIGRSLINWYEDGAIYWPSDSTIKTRVSNKLTNTDSGIIWLHN
jgi:hypothetical protein